MGATGARRQEGRRGVQECPRHGVKSIAVQLGPYQLLDRIGAGGMGEVWKATDTRLGRTVAVKICNEQFGERFGREARAVAALNHPNICTLFDVGPNYLVMEYIEGSPVAGPLPPEEALRLAVQIAGALEQAHGRGIVHRDLKPANILVADGQVKLLDFGLAKQDGIAAGDAKTVTNTLDGTLLGTVPYMSPEQAEGKPVDGRSDIFSFGLVLYEMLSGQRAFPGESAVAVLAAILHKEPAPLCTPEGLARIVARCLRKMPGDRFQTAADVKRALEEARSGTMDAKPIVTDATPSIAVLPFANIGGDQENEVFSDGLAEEIINGLAQLPGLKITARTSAFAFRGKNEDARRIGETLGVAHLLEGSVRRAGSRIRVTAELISTGDGCHVWGQRYDRELNDIFGIQDEISQAVVQALQVALVRRPQSAIIHRQTTNMAAYQAYLEGRQYLSRLTSTGIARSRECLERAIACDPNYALAYAGIAEVCHFEIVMGIESPDRARAEALRAAEKALALDPAAAEALVIRALIRGLYGLDWAASGADFARAIELNPASAITHCRRATANLIPLGRLEEGIAELDRAAELDPLAPMVRFSQAHANHMIGRTDCALSQLRAASELFPDYVLGCHLSCLIGMCAGMRAEAEQALHRVMRADPENTLSLASEAVVHGGDPAESKRLRLKFEELGKRRKLARYLFLILETAAGDHGAAIEWINQAISEGETLLLLLTFRDPYFRELRGHEKFPAILRRLNLG